MFWTIVGALIFVFFLIPIGLELGLRLLVALFLPPTLKYFFFVFGRIYDTYGMVFFGLIKIQTARIGVYGFDFLAMYISSRVSL